MTFAFNHFNFNVLDLEKSLKFYEEALGLKEVRRKAVSYTHLPKKVATITGLLIIFPIFSFFNFTSDIVI